MQQVVALVPMRHDSERVKGKNYRELAGRPLYEHILQSLQRVPSVSQILVDTDSPIIWDGVSTSFPEVVLLDRPAHLRAGTVPMNQVLEHDVRQVEAEYFLQTHTTNPLLRPETIERAIECFFANWPEHDSLFSVARMQNRLWSSDAKPINHNPAQLARTQDLEPIFLENSAIFLFERRTFLARKNRIGVTPFLFEMGVLEGWDIDSEADFALLDCVARDRLSGLLDILMED